MVDNVQKSTGTSRAYKTDAGGAPVDPGPHIGIVKNNIDLARTGRLQVYIEYLSLENENDPQGWKSVSYISPFYGQTSPPAPRTGNGSFLQNPHSYGMWFTPPDIGTRVICVFAQGDPNQGYYFGSVVNPDSHHMLPAIGSSTNYEANAELLSTYFKNASALPVVEINDKNAAADGPRFFDLPKPVHSYAAFVLLQQGLLTDPVRGVIGSNSYRETPSTLYGISTPGRPIYGGGYDESEFQTALSQDANSPGAASLDNFEIIGRRGGHSLIMDDGDSSGNDQHVRIRTAQGHQIIMSDTGQCVHIMHANGQSWIELGSEGTIDLYATNSVNIRSSGDINMHADRNINLNSRYGSLNIASDRAVVVESDVIQISGKKAMLMASEKYVGVRSDGTLSLKAEKTGTFNGGDNMVMSAGCISLNGGSAPDVPKTVRLNRYKLPDVTWKENEGWEVKQNELETIVTRAPTHEPYPLHGRGINTTANLSSVAEDVPLPVEVQDRLASIQDLQVATINIADYEATAYPDNRVGELDQNQVRAMLAQQSFVTGQAANVISNEKGVGKYGFTASQLETAGYLKPGTVEFYLAGDINTEVDILQNPNVWTGLAGIDNVSTLLNDNELQDAIQSDLYTTGLNNLQNLGIVSGQENAADLAGLVQAASVYPAETVRDWINGNVQSTPILNDINTMVRGTQYSVNLADEKISNDIKGIIAANDQTDTANRLSIDVSAASVLDEKTPPPNYAQSFEQPPRVRQLASNGNLTQFNIERSDPYVIRIINDVLTKIHGTRELLLKYYGPAQPQDRL